MVKIEEVDGWKDCPKSQMVAGLDSQECHHPRWRLKKRNLGGVDGERWRELMVGEEEVGGWRKRNGLRTVDCGLRTPPPRCHWSRWSPLGEVDLGPDCGPWNPPPRRGQSRGCPAWRDPEGGDQVDEHVPGPAFDPLKSGGV